MSDPETAGVRPLVISVPEPRSLDLIFTPDARTRLHERYDIVETTAPELATLPAEVLGTARYVVGQPPISPATLAAMKSLRCVFNVETNLINNMPYDTLFERGIHVVTTGLVFAEPVAELGLALALDLARDIVDADLDFREGREKWGGDGNASARLLSGSDIGIIGFGDLGRALARLLSGFRPRIRVYDPWLPPSILKDAGVAPADLGTVLSESDTVFVVAAVTTENRAFLGAEAFRFHASRCELHPAQPCRRGRLPGADGGRRKRPYPCGQRRLSRGTAGQGPSGPPVAALPALRSPRRSARHRLQAHGGYGARGHGA